MSPEQSPQSGRMFISPEQEARMQQEARDRVRARIHGESTPPPAVRQPRPRPVAPQPTMPASHQPAPSPVRAPRRVSSMPVSGGAPLVSRAEAGIQSDRIPSEKSTTPSKLIESKDGESRTVERSRRRGGIAITAVLVIGGIATLGITNKDKITSFNTEEIFSASGQAVTGHSGEASQYGETILPPVTGAEGLNLQNCKKDGSAIATIMIADGNFPLRYLIQPADGSAPKVEPPYMTSDNLKDANAAFITESGYPEMTIHNTALEIHACQKEGQPAVIEGSDGTEINATNIDFSVSLNLPPEQENGVQDEAYMDTSEKTLFTWPAQTFLAPNGEENAAAIDAVKKAHAGADQQIGVFNTAIQMALASASDATATSDFNETVTFVDDDTQTVYDAIKEGLRIRVNAPDAKIVGTIGSLAPELIGDKKPTLIDTSGNPEDNFQIKSGEVIVGSYVAPHGEEK